VIKRQQFAGNNYAGACPEALRAMIEANSGSAVAYGDDEWTQRAADAFQSLFETDCEVIFVLAEQRRIRWLSPPCAIRITA
jgi:threonine aldolase